MNKILKYILILFVVSGTCCFGSESTSKNSKSNKIENYITQGEKFKKNNNLQEALYSYQKAINLNKNNAKAHIGIASIYGRLRDYNKAVEEFEVGLNLDKNFELSVLPKLIMIHLFKENITEVKKCLEIIKHRDRNLYGMIYEQIILIRIYGLSENDYAFILKVPMHDTPSKKYSEISNHAYALLQENKIEESIKTLEEYTNSIDILSKDKALAYNELGKTYLQYINIIEGINYLNKAIEIYPKYIYWRQELTLTLISTQLYTKALSETEKILKLEPNDKFCHLAQGIIYNEFGWYNKAIEAWEKLNGQDKFLFILIEDNYLKIKTEVSKVN